MRVGLGWAVIVMAAVASCGEAPEAREQREQGEMAAAQKLIAAGKYSEARAELADVSASPQLTALLNQITEGTKQQEAVRVAREAMERATSIKEKLERLEGSELDNMAQVRAALSSFEDAERFLISTKGDELEPQAAGLRQEIRKLLSRKQAALFPRMRGVYAKELATTLWENDVEVVASGGGNKRIRFIAGMFAANRNIADAQQAAGPMLRQLRFSRSQYEWYRGSEYTFYDMKPEADGHVPD